MPIYYDGIMTLLENNQKNHEYSKIESLMMDVVKECAESVKDNDETSKAMSKASQTFETVINHAWKMMYLIPMIPIIDEPEKWVIMPESPLVGKEFRTSKTHKVKVEMIERHADTIDGTPGCVYRINANSKLAFMLYGNTIVEYKTEDGENMDMVNNYSCACFVNQFPFTVPYPSVTTIIHATTKDADGKDITEDCGFISDIRNISREEISAEELQNHFFSPKGTSLYPKLTDEEAESLDNTESEAE